MKVDWVPLSRVLTPRRGESLDADADRSYPIAGVYGFGRGLLIREAIAGSGTKYRSMCCLSLGDLVYSKVKAFEGAVAVVGESGVGRWVSPEFPVFSVGPAVAPDYLRHYVSSDDFQRQLRAGSSGIGARRERVAPERFLELRMPRPSLPDQRRIAAHLDRMSLPGQAAAMPPRSARPLKARVLTDRTLGAPSVRLGDFLSPVASVEVVPEQIYGIAGVYSFGRGLLRRPAILGSDTKYKAFTQLQSGSVVYSKLGAFEGAVAVVDEAFDSAWVSPEFPVFLPDDTVDSEYLRHVLTSPGFEAQLAAATAGVGARQKRVSPSAFLSQRVAVPEDVREQQEIARVLGLADEAQQRADRARGLRTALLPAARNEIFSAMR